MKTIILHIILSILMLMNFSCNTQNQPSYKTAKDILGNPNYKCICYGGFRSNSRDVVPSISEIKEDLKILSALNFKLIRTYNVHIKEIDHILEAITQLKKEDDNFEMYVMLGAWIDCKNAWTNIEPIHHLESDRNEIEILRAITLANKYPDIIKIIAVGNEAMVKWATSYYVTPNIILKWVKFLQQQKLEKKLPSDIWITSSDNFASWGGGTNDYHTADLNELIKSVDYISMHTYPMHDTHYNPIFWGIYEEELQLSKKDKIQKAMRRAANYAINQYESVFNYMKSLGVDKPIHIGETGWASQSNEFYGNSGSKATDEYKAALYYQLITSWCSSKNISCFYFEAFDENWKDAQNPLGSENHFGLFTIEGKAKYVLWDEVDKNTFKGLQRSGKAITKTYNGNENLLLENVFVPNFIQVAETIQ